MSEQSNKTLVLASTSPFRREILMKLGIPFETTAPDADETPLENEKPHELVTRLSLAKAKAVVDEFPDALIIGCDQVATIDGEILGKPGNFERAAEQLKLASGRSVEFLTGMTLLDSGSGKSHSICEPFKVHFRPLSDSQIKNYLNREEPYNCAGSFRSEALGIALFRRLEGEDPNALIGLPLIRLIDLMAEFDINVLD